MYPRARGLGNKRVRVAQSRAAKEVGKGGGGGLREV